MTTEAQKPTGPVARDPFNPNVVIPVYAGGEGPVEMPSSSPVDRGDVIEPPKNNESPPEKKGETPAVVPQGSVATTVAETAKDETDESVSTETAPETDDTTTETADDSAGKQTTTDDRPRNEKGQFIPRSRFNEVNEERKRLAQRVAELEGQQQAVQQVEEDTYDFDAKEKEYANLVLDGKIDEAIALRKEIRAAEQAQFEKIAAQKTVETTKQMTVQEQIENIAYRYATALPQFDPESDDYNDELMADVQDIYRGALESGRYQSPAQAFQASIDKALKLHGLSLPSDTATQTQAPAKQTQQQKQQIPPVRTAQKRVEAIASQPPSLNGIGTTGAPTETMNINVANLSDAEFAKLPEATRRRLRGDMI